MQEAGRRAGTENVLGIVGVGAAAAIVTKEQESTARHMAAMRDDLQDQMLHAFPEVLPVHAACDMYEWNRLALDGATRCLLSVHTTVQIKPDSINYKLGSSSSSSTMFADAVAKFAVDAITMPAT